MRRLTILFIGLVAMSLLAACSGQTTAIQAEPQTTTAPGETVQPENTLFPLTIADALGQEYTFDAPPKIGCDWYGCYETMADLGSVLHAASMSPEMAEAPFYSPVGPPEYLIEDLSNPELWAATEMDVFISRVPDDPYYDVFREMVPVFFLHHPSYGVSSVTGYRAYIANARLLGQLSGKSEAAETAIARFETMIANLRTLSTPELAAQTVGILWSDVGYSGLATNNPFCMLLADVGLGHCMGESTGRYVEYNAEEVLALNPDQIIYMLEGGPSHTERTDPVWAELTAVKEGRVFDVIGHRYTCCSMRGLIHSFQEYVSHVVPEAGIPAPGPVETFDPTQSPLVTSDFTSGTTASNAVRIHTDAYGRQVEPPSDPQRIVAHYFASDMVALGLPMIGTNYINAEQVLTPEQLQGISDTGLGDPNLETVFSLQPDLIFVPDFTEASVVDLLAEIAPTVVIPYGGDPFARLRLFGEIVGKVEAAEAWIDAYNTKAEAKRQEVAPFIAEGETASAFIMYGDGQLYLYGRPRLGSILYDVFGFVAPPEATELFKDDPGALWQAISLELLPNYVGDRIFLIQSDDEEGQEATAALLDNPIWQNLPAVRNGKLYQVSGRWAFNDPLTLDWLLDQAADVLVE